MQKDLGQNFTIAEHLQSIPCLKGTEGGAGKEGGRRYGQLHNITDTDKQFQTLTEKTDPLTY